MSFDEIFDPTAGVYLNFHEKYTLYTTNTSTIFFIKRSMCMKPYDIHIEDHKKIKRNRIIWM